MQGIHARLQPPLDPDFVPASLWHRAYLSLCRATPGSRRAVFVLDRGDGDYSRHETHLLPASAEHAALTLRFAERLLKFLLWQQGGGRVLLSGADEVAASLSAIYSPAGARAFDHDFMGTKVYRRPFVIEACSESALPAVTDRKLDIGRHLGGCRIGFDLGGSDRKAAAVIDGKVVYSEEIAWNPYFESDPTYHIEGVHDSLKRAAAHLPRVDAIGGSAAGVYVANEARVASLFRGVPAEAFEKHIRRMFFTLRERWGGVPFEVANDGEVTALAGSMSLDSGSVLGISMGTSQAGGYVTPEGSLTPWLNELAFVPVDYNENAPADEWAGDRGCGVQYFSQQCVARLADRAGLGLDGSLPAPEKLKAVQELMAKGDPRVRDIYVTIGRYLGYALGHYANFYEIRHVLLLGRVTTGPGGDLILDEARAVLRAEFPELADRLTLGMPDETMRRHGQAIAAASLPALQP